MFIMFLFIEEEKIGGGLKKEAGGDADHDFCLNGLIRLYGAILILDRDLKVEYNSNVISLLLFSYSEYSLLTARRVKLF